MKKPPFAILNRGAALFLFREPFAQWANGLPSHEGPPIDVEDLNREPEVYLVPVYESDEEFLDWLAERYEDLWRELLNSWTTEERVWPEERSMEMFVEWFQPVLLSLVYDLTDQEYKLEDIES